MWLHTQSTSSSKYSFCLGSASQMTWSTMLRGIWGTSEPRTSRFTPWTRWDILRLLNQKVWWWWWCCESVTQFFCFQFKYGKISSKHNGSVKKGVIFATYSSLIGESQSGGKYKTRFEQLLHWCGEDYDGVVSFHRWRVKVLTDLF